MNQGKLHSRSEKNEAFEKIVEVLDILRVKCPWDAKQTNESLRANTIEEVYELTQALMNGDNNDIKKELGDVLLHILFYAKIGEEKGAFDIADVCDALREKLVFRHPHVFGDTSVNDSREVERNWEQIKLKEKDGNKSVLSGVPEALPAMIKAYRVQEKAAHVGFDWEKREDVFNKLAEETAEVSQAIKNGTKDDIEAEFGDMLFAVINAARLYDVNPENALERTNRKFISRFNYIEKCAKEQNLSLKDMTLEQMDVFWNQAKDNERQKCK